MPSDYAKKKAKAKKEAAKVKGGKKPGATSDSSAATSASATPAMTPVASSADLQAINNGGGAAAAAPAATYEEELCHRLDEEARLASEARACTGVLGIHPMSRDIKIDNFSVTFHGAELLHDTRQVN